LPRRDSSRFAFYSLHTAVPDFIVEILAVSQTGSHL
jgi:hypothetical protein